MVAAAIALQLWLLPVLISLAPFIANWWRYLTHLPMHCGLRTNVPDVPLPPTANQPDESASARGNRGLTLAALRHVVAP